MCVEGMEGKRGRGWAKENGLNGEGRARGRQLFSRSSRQAQSAAEPDTKMSGSFQEWSRFRRPLRLGFIYDLRISFTLLCQTKRQSRGSQLTMARPLSERRTACQQVAVFNCCCRDPSHILQVGKRMEEGS